MRIFAALALLLLAGCASPVGAPEAAPSPAALEPAAREGDEAAAPNVTQPRVVEGTFRFVAASRPGIVFYNGGVETVVGAGDRLTAQATWSFAAPTASRLMLFARVENEPIASVSGVSPLELVVPPSASPRIIDLFMDIEEPGAVVREEVAVAMIVTPASAPGS